MFVLARALVYATLFVGFLLIFLPARLLDSTALLGAAVYYEALPLLAYAALFLAAMHAFLRLYEEPALRGTFGADYDAYCHDVGRWWPHRPR